MCGVLLAAAPSAAVAEPIPTPQAAGMNAAWVEGLMSADMAPTRAVTCIVDTGAIVTPDTPATDPAGPIVARVGLGSIGPDPGSGDVERHGTFMASAAVAPRNGWGTVGLEPQGRVVLVRAQADSSSAFTSNAVQQAIRRCRRFLAETPQYRVTSISLSLGHTGTPSPLESALVDDQVSQAIANGVAVVAAAGNDSGATQFPASAANVLAVGAGYSSGGLCSYASFDGRTDMVAPGCGILEATDLAAGAAAVDSGGGSSTATVLVAQAITILCDIVPGLTGVQAQATLVATARHEGNLVIPDLEAAARSLGAGSLVDRGRVNQPTGPAIDLDDHSSPGSQSKDDAVTIAPASRLKLRGLKALWAQRKSRRSGTLTVSITGRGRGEKLRASVYAGRTEFSIRRIARTTQAASRVTFTLRAKPRRVIAVLLPRKGSTSRESLAAAAGIRNVHVRRVTERER